MKSVKIEIMFNSESVLIHICRKCKNVFVPYSDRYCSRCGSKITSPANDSFLVDLRDKKYWNNEDEIFTIVKDK